MPYVNYFTGDGVPTPGGQAGVGVYNVNSYIWAGVAIDIGTDSQRIEVFHDGVRQDPALGHYTRIGNLISSAGWRVASGPPDNVPASIITVVES